MQLREVFFNKSVLFFSAVNTYQLEKCFKTKTRLCQKCSYAVGMACVVFFICVQRFMFCLRQYPERMS